MLKIETQKGLVLVWEIGSKLGRLIAARGDLFVEVPKPHKIISALNEIIQADPHAIVASRVLDSMAFHPVPVSAEISDVAYLISLGYQTFTLGDTVCFERDTLIEPLNLLGEISQEFE